MKKNFVFACLILLSPQIVFSAKCAPQFIASSLHEWTSEDWSRYINAQFSKLQRRGDPPRTRGGLIRKKVSSTALGEFGEGPFSLVPQERHRLTLDLCPIGVRISTEAHLLSLDLTAKPTRYRTWSKKTQDDPRHPSLVVENYNLQSRTGAPLTGELPILFEAMSDPAFSGKDFVGYFDRTMDEADARDFEEMFANILSNREHRFTQFVQQRIKKNRGVHLRLLKEVLLHVLPDYVRRRGWDDPKKMDEFVGDAYETLSNTSYTLVRSKSDNKILGIVGYTFAAYGAVIVAGPSGLELIYGPFGTTYEAHHGNAALDSDEIARIVSQSPGSGAALHRLPVEMVMGTDVHRPLVSDYRLPQPIELPGQRTILPWVLRGVIGEPVKLWMPQGIGEQPKDVRIKLIQSLLGFQLFTLDGQLRRQMGYQFYTYGNEVSSRLWGALGYDKDGTSSGGHDAFGKQKPGFLLSQGPRELAGRLKLDKGSPRDIDTLFEAVQAYLTSSHR